MVSRNGGARDDNCTAGCRTPSGRQRLERTREITLRGCVEPGAKEGHYLVTNVTEMQPAGGSAMPAFAHGRRVVFWLEDLPNLRKHMNHMIEIRGDFKDIKKSETDPKVRRGVVVVELEGPGRDVDVSASQAERAIGTAGINKMKTFLIRVDVDDVKMVSTTCM